MTAVYSTPFGDLEYWTNTDDAAIVTESVITMASVRDAFTAVSTTLTGSYAVKTYKWANSTARGAQTGMTEGDHGYQEDTDTEYEYSGSAWVALVKFYRWANTAARTAQTNMSEGDMGDQLDTNITYRYNGSAWKATSSGLIPVVPTGVSGSGVTKSSGGLVIMTAAPGAISVEGCFSAEFTNYRIEFEATSSSSVSVTLRMRLGSTDATGATDYDIQTLQGQTSTAAAALTNSNTWTITPNAGTLHDFSIDLKRPFLASPTFGKSLAYSGQIAGLSAPGLRYGGILHRLSTSYDGFTFTPSAGNTTGTIRIYGWNDNT